MSFFTNKIYWKSKKGKAIIALISLSVLLPLIGNLLSKRKYLSARQAYEACQVWKANAVRVEIDFSEEQKRLEEEAKKQIEEEAKLSPPLQDVANDFEGVQLPYLTDQGMRDMKSVGTIIRKCESEDLTRQVIGLEIRPEKKGKVLTSDEWNAQSDNLYATKNFRY